MWDKDPIVLQLVEYMIGRGCTGTIQPPSKGPFGNNEMGYLILTYSDTTHRVEGEDIYNALHAAYRVEWEIESIRRRFERYLIDLYNKRQKGIL